MRVPAARVGRAPRPELPPALREGLTAVVLAVGLGAMAAFVPKAALAAAIAVLVLAALVRAPALSLVAVLVIASIWGREGAHWLVPPVDLPVLETLLAAAGAASIALLAYRTDRDSLGFGTVVPWLGAAAWGLALVVFVNRGTTIDGVREAMIFVYPLLVALPLATLSAAELRRFVDRWAPALVLLGGTVAAIGVLNQAIGNVGATDTGQVRALAGSFAPVLFAAAMASLYMHTTGRWGDLKTAIGAAPAGALLLVNHRSAYLAVIFALLVYAAMRRQPSSNRRTPRPTLSRFAWVAGVMIVVVLVATPAGRAGLDRFESLGSEKSGNIVDRRNLAARALELHGRQWVIGTGVGTLPAEISGPEEQRDLRYGVHNSFLAALRSGGGIGLAFLLVPIALALIRLARRRADPMVQMLAPVAAFTLAMAVFNVVLENGYFSVWVWLPLIVGVHVARANERTQTTPIAPL